MPTVLYEHPLNERVRNYLKLEQLFVQVENCTAEQIQQHYQTFFNALFTIVDTIERNDIRGELIKDLEKLEHLLLTWSKAPEIDNSALQESLKQIVSLTCLLRKNSTPWSMLKEDKFLSGIKQRFAIQGGSSTFDLPQLQFWLYHSLDTVESSITRWLDSLNAVKESIHLVLKFLRQRSDFDTIKTDSGFYQDSGEGLLLLRIKLNSQLNYFPMISGNKFRYSIRFMLPCELSGRKYSNQATTFELARC